MERIAHRGAKREFPENTLAAFARAYERGADAVELDVHATADGVVVVHHDPRIRGAGAIARASWTEVAAIDLGGGAHVPTLADVLAATPANATVYVEIKATCIEDLVAAVIRQSSASCAVHSFDLATIARMRDLAPEIPRGLLFEDTHTDMVQALRATDARDLWPEWPLIDAELVRAIHANGGRVIAWTVNDSAKAQGLAALGVDGLCGDDIRLLP